VPLASGNEENDHMRNASKTLISSFVLAGTFALAACSGGGDKAASANPEAVKEAKQVWETRCVTCHGNNGLGDGPGAAALNPKPRSFSDKQWQMKTKDEDISKVIVEGGKAVGMSEAMAANPDLADKPEVVDELVKIVRSFK